MPLALSIQLSEFTVASPTLPGLRIQLSETCLNLIWSDLLTHEQGNWLVLNIDMQLHLIIPFNASFWDALNSMFMSWTEQRDNYLHSSKPIINYMYYLHAFTPFSFSHTIILLLPLFSFHVLLSLYDRFSLSPWTHYHLLLTRFWSAVTFSCAEPCKLTHIHFFLHTHIMDN